MQPAQAQECSPAQQDVWKDVEGYWARDAAGDLDGFLLSLATVQESIGGG